MESSVDSQLLHMKSEFLRKNAAFYYTPIEFQQSKTAVDRPAKGPVWVSRATFPPILGHAVISAITQALRDLRSGGEVFETSVATDVKVQWTGPRRGALPNDPEPDIDEREKYRRLAEEVTTDTVIYYFHGGFYCQGGSAAARVLTRPLSGALSGRVVSLDYRLSPQNQFPAALVDSFVGYLSLLYPPKGAFHNPIKPEKIVFAGESAGGSLAAALLLVIQNIHVKDKGSIQTHNGSSIAVPMPAGFAGIGSHFDYTSSHGQSPINLKYDFLTLESPYMCAETPDSTIWPSNPPRGEVYCATSVLCHPLVSPLSSRSWVLFPPMFLAYGEDHMIHQGEFVARRARNDGVAIQFHHYEHQLHVFPVLFPDFGPSRHLLGEMARFAEQCCDGGGQRGRVMESRKVRHPPSTGEVGDVELEVAFPEEDFEERLAKMRARQKGRKVWTGAKKTASL